MHTIYIYSDSVHFNNNSYAMQSSVPTLSCLADSNLNMCLQKWFQRKCETMIKLTIPEVG
jgi:hypothetical protein